LGHGLLNLDSYSEERARRYFQLDKTTLPPDIEHISKTYLPDYELSAMFYIEKRLGYPPTPLYAKPHEFYIRWIICRYHMNEIMHYDQLASELEVHAKHIRNAEMKKTYLVTRECISYSDMVKYETENLEHKEIVRSKIQCLLGYIPDLHYTLDHEIFMREIINDLEPEKRFEINEVDYRLVTAIQYRETYLKHGEQAADALPLLGPCMFKL
jgi:hypothetical protein